MIDDMLPQDPLPEDPRIPVRFGAPPGAPGVACVLALGGDAPAVPHAFFGPARHAVGCACCGGRAPVAEALSRLFLRAARGELPTLSAVYAPGLDAAGRAALAEILVRDRVCAARFRLDAESAIVSG